MAQIPSAYPSGLAAGMFAPPAISGFASFSILCVVHNIQVGINRMHIIALDILTTGMYISMAFPIANLNSSGNFSLI